MERYDLNADTARWASELGPDTVGEPLSQRRRQSTAEPGFGSERGRRVPQPEADRAAQDLGSKAPPQGETTPMIEDNFHRPRPTGPTATASSAGPRSARGRLSRA